MKRRQLGRTGIAVTELGFGGAPLGGLFAAVGASDANAALEAAWDAGVRYFDTAPLYGFGLSEQRIGSFLRSKPRDAFVLSTKVGRTLRPRHGVVDDAGSLANFVDALPNEATFDFSAEAVKRSIEGSLERLQLGRIDILYMHDPDDRIEEVMHTTYPLLRELRERGIVRAIGAGSNRTAPLEELVRRCELDVVMLAGRYTVLDRSGEDRLLGLCAERGVAVAAAGVFNSGILAAPSPQAGATFDYAPASADILTRTRRMAELCKRHGVELPAAALQFPLREPGVACVVAGMRSPQELRDNVRRLRAALPPALWHELAREALGNHASRR